MPTRVFAFGPIVVLICLGLCSCAAENQEVKESRPFTPFKLTVSPHVSFPGSDFDVYGLHLDLLPPIFQASPIDSRYGVDIGLLGSISNKIWGLQVGGLMCYGAKTRALQIGLVGNGAKDIKGAQVSSIWNYAEYMQGAQLSGMFNLSAQESAGYQAALLGNLAGRFNGLQTSLLYNAAMSASGGASTLRWPKCCGKLEWCPDRVGERL